MNPPDDPELERRLAQQKALRALLAVALRRRAKLAPLLMIGLLLLGLAQFSAERWLGPDGELEFLLAGAHIPSRVLRGDWWRLFTGPALHAEWTHLLLNMASLFVVGRLVEAVYGPSRFWLIWSGSALSGALAALTWQPAASVGASGAVFGLVAALVALGLRLWPRMSGGMRQTLVLVPGLLLFLMLGTGGLASGADVDHVSHVGGSLGGLCLGLVLHPQLRADGGAGRMWPRLWVRIVAWLAAVVTLVALGLAALRVGAPIELPVVQPAYFSHEGWRIAFPDDTRRGFLSLREGFCRGALADPAWGLQTGRLPCWHLPLGGTLVLGERNRLFTMDEGDWKALREAGRTGKFVQRQAHVLVHPIGDRWVYVVRAEDPLLPSLARSLQPILPPPGTAVVEPPAAPTPTDLARDPTP